MHSEPAGDDTFLSSEPLRSLGTVTIVRSIVAFSLKYEALLKRGTNRRSITLDQFPDFANESHFSLPATDDFFDKAMFFVLCEDASALDVGHAEFFANLSDSPK